MELLLLAKLLLPLPSALPALLVLLHWVALPQASALQAWVLQPDRSTRHLPPSFLLQPWVFQLQLHLLSSHLHLHLPSSLPLSFLLREKELLQ